jgi:hypothetical protein
MSYYRAYVNRNLLALASGGLLMGFIAFANCFSSLLNGPRHESANAFADLFGRFRDQVMCWTVQVPSDAVWKPFPRPTTFTAVTLGRHKSKILLVPS